jgi:hypothetical protein
MDSALVELTATVSTLGLLCLTKSVTICKDARKTATGADGRYSFTMSGKEGKDALGNPARFLISARLPSGAPGADALQPHHGHDRRSHNDFLGAGPSFRRSRRRFRDLFVQRTATIIWVQGEPHPVRRDHLGPAIATVEKPGVGVTFTTDYHPPRIPLRGKASPPASRDGPCWVAGASEPQRLQPCPLTDGRYGASFPSQSCPAASPSPAPSPKRCRANGYVGLGLGAPLPLNAVFLYGLGMSAERSSRFPATVSSGRRSRARSRWNTSPFPCPPARPAGSCRSGPPTTR